MSRHERVIAVGVDKLAPTIALYSYPERQLLGNLEAPGSAKLAYSALSFNRTGNLLASVSSLPDFVLTLWDWKQRTVIATASLEHMPCDSVSFNPRSKDLLCTVGADRAVVWRVESVLEKPTLTPMYVCARLLAVGSVSVWSGVSVWYVHWACVCVRACMFGGCVVLKRQTERRPDVTHACCLLGGDTAIWTSPRRRVRCWRTAGVCATICTWPPRPDSCCTRTKPWT